jgi:NAD(P)-dependent dehydrogenase (short-subunit alcohol dehydrogenase family)
LNRNRVALVTGANRGIGFAVCEALLHEGCTVIVTSRNEALGLEAFGKLEVSGKCSYHPLDIDDPLSIASIKQYVSEMFGRLDILINNAAINYDTWHTCIDADLDEVTQTIETNLMGAWRMCQAFVPMMRSNGYGRIVNVSSGAGALSSMSGSAPGYSVSKAALNALTVQLARTLRGENILVNSVCPGWVRTKMGGEAAPRSPQQGAETIVWAAMLDTSGPSGKFLRDKQIIPW